jgi:hypothetical protein
MSFFKQFPHCDEARHACSDHANAFFFCHFRSPCVVRRGWTPGRGKPGGSPGSSGLLWAAFRRKCTHIDGWVKGFARSSQEISFAIMMPPPKLAIK